MERFDRVGGLEKCFYEPKESNVRIWPSESATRDCQCVRKQHAMMIAKALVKCRGKDTTRQGMGSDAALKEMVLMCADAHTECKCKQAPAHPRRRKVPSAGAPKVP